MSTILIKLISYHSYYFSAQWQEVGLNNSYDEDPEGSKRSAMESEVEPINEKENQQAVEKWLWKAILYLTGTYKG